MANEANKNERTSLDDRRNNLRERIANDAGARIDRKKRLNANASKSKEDGPKSKKAYIEDEKEFEKSISKLSPEEIKQKRLERIPYLEQLYRKLKISEYFLVERSRQLYHNISGEIPQFFRRPKIDEKTFNKTLGKGLSKAERKEKYDNYKTLSEEEIKDFDGKVDAKKELLPSIPLDAGRYKEFATLEEKEIYEENQATMKKALEKLKEEHPDEYKKEMDKRAKEETARQNERREIFYGRIKVVEESIKSEREYSRAELEKKIARFNEKLDSSDENIDDSKKFAELKLEEKLKRIHDKVFSSHENALYYSEELAELDEENRAITAKYDEQLAFLKNHTEDLWNVKYEAFTGDKKKFLDLYLSTNKESIKKDAIKKALKDELYNDDYSSEEYDSAVDEYNEKLAFLDENFDKLKIADYEDLNNRWKAKKAEEKKQEAERKNAPTNKKVVDLKWQMETDLLETCNAANLYASTRLQYGLNYASDHYARIDRSILMPALDELSELTVISHDVDAEYNKQNVAVQNDIKTHQKAKPWIIAKWLGVPRWKKWEKRNNELEAKKADLDTLVQKAAEQKQIISQYVTGLKNAGVSQAMIDRCTTYDIAVANNQITEDEITAEVLNCKEQFKKKIISLNQEGKKQEIANIYESRMKCLHNGPDNMRQIRDGVLTKEEMAELYPEKQDSDETKIASTNPALRTELIDTGEMPTNEALFQDFLYDFEKDPATTGAVDQYIEEVQKTVDVGDFSKYYKNAPTGESTENDKLDENLYADLAKRINERKAQEEKNIVNQEESSKNIVNKEKNIVNTESEINSKNTVEQNTASPEALAYLKNIRGKMISINAEAIFADEYEFFEKMGAFDVPKIKTDSDLQNSLGKNTVNKSKLSKFVKENDSKQLEKESIENKKDSITNN